MRPGPAAAPPEALGRVFGFHGAVDTAGAILGPLTALTLAGFLPLRDVFAFTALPGLAAAVSFYTAAQGLPLVVRRDARQPVPRLDPAFYRFLVAVGLNALGAVAATLYVYRAMQTLPVSPHLKVVLPVALYAATNAVYALAAYPLGHRADRKGTAGVLVGTYLVLAAADLGFALFPLPWVLPLLFAGLGIGMAGMETLEGALAASLLGPENRAAGLGLWSSTTGTLRIAASFLAALLWATVGGEAVFLYAAAAALAGAVVLLATRRQAA